MISRGEHQRVVDVGYTSAEAEFLDLLNSEGIRTALAKAAEQHSGRYAACTHGLYNVISTRAAAGAVAPRCYWHLLGQGSLASMDARWASILEPDDHGWRGLTSYGALAVVAARPCCYSAKGLLEEYNGEFFATDSPVVCFESTPAERVNVLGGALLHSAVVKSGDTYVLPPLTLLEVTEVTENCFEYLPGKIIEQTLVTVRPTFLRSSLSQASDEGEEGAEQSDKYTQACSDLVYGGTADAVRGLDDITGHHANPIST